MNDSVIVKLEFFLWSLFSIVLPVGIYGYMLWKKTNLPNDGVGFLA